MPTSLSSTTRESHLAAARELVFQSISEEVVTTLRQTVFNAIIQSNPEARRLGPVFEEFFTRYFTREAMADGIAPLYVERFSELELRQIVWFNNTPVGRRAIAEVPALMQAGSNVGRDIVTSHQAELMQMISDYTASHPPSEGIE